MKKYIIMLAGVALLAGCEKSETTTVNPADGEKKTENNTTVVKEPANSSKTESTSTTVKSDGADTSTKTTTTSSPNP